MSKATVMKAIRLKCLDCCCDQTEEIRLCPMEGKCTLWPYRFGKDEDSRREMTPEQRQAYADRARKNFGIS